MVSSTGDLFVTVKPQVWMCIIISIPLNRCFLCFFYNKPGLSGSLKGERTDLEFSGLV